MHRDLASIGLRGPHMAGYPATRETEEEPSLFWGKYLGTGFKTFPAVSRTPQRAPWGLHGDG
jgi:hypothetical protein